MLRQEEDPTRGKARPDPVTMALEGSSIVENQPFLEDIFLNDISMICFDILCFFFLMMCYDIFETLYIYKI